MSDQEIRVTLLFETEQAIKNQERARIVLNQLKTYLQSLVKISAESGNAFGSQSERVRVLWQGEVVSRKPEVDAVTE